MNFFTDRLYGMRQQKQEIPLESVQRRDVLSARLSSGWARWEHSGFHCVQTCSTNCPGSRVSLAGGASRHSRTNRASIYGYGCPRLQPEVLPIDHAINRKAGSPVSLVRE